MIETRPIRRPTHTPWMVTHKGDRACRALADRHYSRQKPGTTSWTRNGQNLVLVLPDETAVWALHRPKPGKANRTDGRDAWECVIFRNESDLLSSRLIRQAVEVCRMLAFGYFGCRGEIERWGRVPKDGLVTYVDPSKVATEVPGWCFRCAGWRRVGYARDGKPLFRAPLPPPSEVALVWVREHESVT